MQNALTAAERRWVSAWLKECAARFGGTNIAKEMLGDVHDIRKRMRKNAYHEAGHAVAAFFFGIEGHNNKVSIRPTKKWGGIFTPGQAFFHGFAFEAKKHIVFSLAGPEAQFMSEGRGGLHWDDFFDACEGEIDDRGDPVLEEGTDLFKAYRYAEFIPGRNLSVALKMTQKLLKRPKVWSGVEKMAHLLTDRLEIRNQNTFYEICAGFQWDSLRLSEWRRYIGGPSASAIIKDDR